MNFAKCTLYEVQKADTPHIFLKCGELLARSIGSCFLCIMTYYFFPTNGNLRKHLCLIPLKSHKKSGILLDKDNGTSPFSVYSFRLGPLL